MREMTHFLLSTIIFAIASLLLLALHLIFVLRICFISIQHSSSSYCILAYSTELVPAIPICVIVEVEAHFILALTVTYILQFIPSATG